MQHSNRELWMAFIAILLITLVYFYAVAQVWAVPSASGLFGHGLGILGFVLMLATEILYSWRKRQRGARWGRMSSWLRFHIFTGLVGPYMVLLHSSWKFNGLAGIVMLLTVIIVLSGIMGRYIYTAIPRTADGVELEAAALESQIAEVEAVLDRWRETQPEISEALALAIKDDTVVSAGPTLSVLGRAVFEARYRYRTWRAKRKLAVRHRTQAIELSNLFKRKRTLQRQVSSLIMARRMLSLWHAVHIPIGLALFATAFVHMMGAIYYATLLR